MISVTFVRGLSRECISIAGQLSTPKISARKQHRDNNDLSTYRKPIAQRQCENEIEATNDTPPVMKIILFYLCVKVSDGWNLRLTAAEEEYAGKLALGLAVIATRGPLAFEF